jgi:hypothetical protein
MKNTILFFSIVLAFAVVSNALATLFEQYDRHSRLSYSGRTRMSGPLI